jgi:hypothetical protein
MIQRVGHSDNAATCRIVFDGTLLVATAAKRYELNEAESLREPVRKPQLWMTD